MRRFEPSQSGTGGVTGARPRAPSELAGLTGDGASLKRAGTGGGGISADSSGITIVGSTSDCAGSDGSFTSPCDDTSLSAESCASTASNHPAASRKLWKLAEAFFAAASIFAPPDARCPPAGTRENARDERERERGAKRALSFETSAVGTPLASSHPHPAVGKPLACARAPPTQR